MSERSPLTVRRPIECCIMVAYKEIRRFRNSRSQCNVTKCRIVHNLYSISPVKMRYGYIGPRHSATLFPKTTATPSRIIRVTGLHGYRLRDAKISFEISKTVYDDRPPDYYALGTIRKLLIIIFFCFIVAAFIVFTEVVQNGTLSRSRYRFVKNRT